MVNRISKESATAVEALSRKEEEEALQNEGSQPPPSLTGGSVFDAVEHRPWTQGDFGHAPQAAVPTATPPTPRPGTLDVDPQDPLETPSWLREQLETDRTQSVRSLSDPVEPGKQPVDRFMLQRLRQILARAGADTTRVDAALAEHERVFPPRGPADLRTMSIWKLAELTHCTAELNRLLADPRQIRFDVLQALRTFGNDGRRNATLVQALDPTARDGRQVTLAMLLTHLNQTRNAYASTEEVEARIAEYLDLYPPAPSAGPAPATVAQAVPPAAACGASSAVAPPPDLDLNRDCPHLLQLIRRVFARDPRLPAELRGDGYLHCTQLTDGAGGLHLAISGRQNLGWIGYDFIPGGQGQPCLVFASRLGNQESQVRRIDRTRPIASIDPATGAGWRTEHGDAHELRSLFSARTDRAAGDYLAPQGPPASQARQRARAAGTHATPAAGPSLVERLTRVLGRLLRH